MTATEVFFHFPWIIDEWLPVTVGHSLAVKIIDNIRPIAPFKTAILMRRLVTEDLQGVWGGTCAVLTGEAISGGMAIVQ